MMLEMRRVALVAEIIFTKKESLQEEETIHCRCSRAFVQWASATFPLSATTHTRNSLAARRTTVWSKPCLSQPGWHGNQPVWVIKRRRKKRNPVKSLKFRVVNVVLMNNWPEWRQPQSSVLKSYHINHSWMNRSHYKATTVASTMLNSKRKG